MKQILEAYPEFHSNLGAYAILRDSILLNSMTDFNTVKAIGKEYPILIHSAKFVSKAMRDHLIANKPLNSSASPNEDSLSDSSSSESDSTSNQRATDIRQISRDQLAQALLLAGTSFQSNNSLSNIAQRSQAQSQATSQPSTSSATSTSGTSASQSTGLISNSIFSNALSQALFAAGAGSAGASNTSTSTQSTSAQPNPSDAQNVSNSQENVAERFANELQTMREMGLQDEMTNLEALLVTNGDVQAAINLVFTSLSN